jgi:hypothetical protein
MLLVRNGNNFLSLDDTSTTQPMPTFLSTIKKTFRIKSDEDAALFEGTLDRIYPISDSMGGEDRKYKKIRRAGQTVTFIRGKFFDNRKGFVMTLGKDGSVTGISYSLEIKP